jgi:serine protease Do
VKGKTLGLFRTLDAGLMKITDPGDFPFAEIGDSTQIHDGQWCIAMGHPGGYQSERGAVLRLGQVLLSSDDAITTYCTLVGGDSGGPLFDMDGRVIGINSRIAEKLQTNMHVPVSVFKEGDTWNRMVKGESWGHLPGHEPYLGVHRDENSKEAKIARVTSDSPAERSGLKPGDVVLAYDDRPIIDFPSLIRAVGESQVNESVVLKIRRNEEQKSIRVRLGRKSEAD